MRSRAARPSPFFLVSATSSAFVLLISVAFATTAVYHPGLFDLVSVSGPAIPPDAYEKCNRATLSGARHLPHACDVVRAGAVQDLRPGILFCFATLIALTALQYWLAPLWRIRRRRLRAIGPELFPEVYPELDRMAAETVGGDRVRFLLDIVNPAVDGLAFGRVRRRYVVLSRGMLDLFERDRSLFRAVVLHELAHVRNRDLDVTAVTLALWRSYFAVILVPGLFAAWYGVSTDNPPVPEDVRLPYITGSGQSWLLGVQIVGLAGLSWLTRSIVLRARELQADARALTWQPDPAPLRRLFGAAPKPRRSIAALRRRTHPHLAARAAALADPGPLMRQGFAFSFALGACFSLDMDPATSLTAQVRTHGFYWPAEAFILVLVVALAIRALRAAAYASAAGGAANRQGARLGLAAGLPLGWMLSPSRMTDHSVASFPTTVQLAGLLALAATGWLLGLWVQWAAKLWEPRVRYAARPLGAALLPLALVTLVVLLSARALYSTQAFIIVAHVAHFPAVSDPVLLALLVTLLVVAINLISWNGLLAGLTVLGMAPLAWFVKRRAGLTGVAAGAPAGRRRYDMPVLVVLGVAGVGWGHVTLFTTLDSAVTGSLWEDRLVLLSGWAVEALLCWPIARIWRRRRRAARSPAAATRRWYDVPVGVVGVIWANFTVFGTFAFTGLDSDPAGTSLFDLLAVWECAALLCWPIVRIWRRRRRAARSEGAVRRGYDIPVLVAVGGLGALWSFVTLLLTLLTITSPARGSVTSDLFALLILWECAALLCWPVVRIGRRRGRAARGPGFVPPTAAGATTPPADPGTGWPDAVRLLVAQANDPTADAKDRVLAASRLAGSDAHQAAGTAAGILVRLATDTSLSGDARVGAAHALAGIAAYRDSAASLLARLAADTAVPGHARVGAAVSLGRIDRQPGRAAELLARLVADDSLTSMARGWAAQMLAVLTDDRPT